MKLIITLKPLWHHNKQQIAIGFGYHDTIRKYIKQFEGVLWSNTHKTFYVNYSQEMLHKLFRFLQHGGYFVDYSSMSYLKNTPKKKTIKIKPPHKVILYRELPKSHKDLLKDYVNNLKGKRLSESTITIYSYFILRFLNYVKDVNKNQWETRHIDLFMENVIAKEAYSISTHRQSISALKYFTNLCKLPLFDASDYERPKKSKHLPIVLSNEAIIDLIRVTKNLKHRVIIALLYSCGFRIGELLQLKLPDIDIARSQIRVLKGKGRKDRVVSMSEVIKPLLINYINTYQPTNYLIEGRDGNAYSAVSVRYFLKQSCKLAGINQKVTPHNLRHCYATHMLENGVDLRYIQELLGHAKPETTMVYTHVAKKDIMQIPNPLDVAIKGYMESDKSNKKVLLSGK